MLGMEGGDGRKHLARGDPTRTSELAKEDAAVFP